MEGGFTNFKPDTRLRKSFWKQPAFYFFIGVAAVLEMAQQAHLLHKFKVQKQDMTDFRPFISNQIEKPIEKFRQEMLHEDSKAEIFPVVKDTVKTAPKLTP